MQHHEQQKETGWRERLLQQFPYLQARKALLIAFIEKEILAARIAQHKEDVEAMPKERSHMDDADYPHDDCMHCTVWNACRAEALTNLSKTKPQ